MGILLSNNNNGVSSKKKHEKVGIFAATKKKEIVQIKTWTKEEVEADRSKAYKYAI